MPYLDRPTARLFYTDEGEGPPVIALHGLAENHLYWKLPGITDGILRVGYRVVSLDMRGHGRSAVTGHPKGFDVEALTEDVSALADYLGFGAFHLLGHATGGMVAFRYAMAHPERLRSLVATNAGAATATVADGDPGSFVAFRQRATRMAEGFRGKTWVQILQHARAGARDDVFLNRLHAARDAGRAFAWYESCARLGDPDTLAEFIERFYDDHDARAPRLSEIGCPCLIVAAEFDEMFLEPSRQAAAAIPNARLAVLEGRGHMTAFEDPERLTQLIAGFLDEVEAQPPA